MQEKFLLLVPESYTEDITIKKLKILPFLKLKQNEQRVSKFLRKNKLDTLKLDMKIEFSSIAGIYQSVKLIFSNISGKQSITTDRINKLMNLTKYLFIRRTPSLRVRGIPHQLYEWNYTDL